MMKGKLKGLMSKAAAKERGDSGVQSHPHPPPKKASGFTALAKDVGSKITQAKSMGVDAGSIGSVENLYRITRFIEKSQENVGASKAHTSSATALKARISKGRSQKQKGKVRTVAQMRSARSQESDHDRELAEAERRRFEQAEEDSRMSLKLGPKARYGDGDGSYWDRWLQGGHLGGDSSWSAGYKPPNSGFKRFNAGELEAAEMADAKVLRDTAGGDAEKRGGGGGAALVDPARTSRERRRAREEFEAFRKGGIAEVARRFRDPPAPKPKADGAAAGETGGAGVEEEDEVLEGSEADDQSSSSSSSSSSSDSGSGSGSDDEGQGGGMMEDGDGGLAAGRGKGGAKKKKKKEKRNLGDPKAVMEAAFAAMPMPGGGGGDAAADADADGAAAADDPAVAEDWAIVNRAQARESYFGEEARWNFFDTFKQLSTDRVKELPRAAGAAGPPGAAASAAAVADNAAPSVSSSGGKLAPLDTAALVGPARTKRAAASDAIGHARALYLDDCHRRDIAPEPLPIRRLDPRSLNAGELRLRHAGLGPDRIGALAACVGGIPLVRHLDFSGNRITDAPYEAARANEAALARARAAAAEAREGDLEAARGKGFAYVPPVNVGISEAAGGVRVAVVGPGGGGGAPPLEKPAVGRAARKARKDKLAQLEARAMASMTIVGRLARDALPLEEYATPAPDDEEEVAAAAVRDTVVGGSAAAGGLDGPTQATRKAARVAAARAARESRTSRWLAAREAAEGPTGASMQEAPAAEGAAAVEAAAAAAAVAAAAADDPFAVVHSDEEEDNERERELAAALTAGSAVADSEAPRDSSTSWELVVRALEALPGLVSLCLSRNVLAPRHCAALCALVGGGRLRELTSIDLSECALGDREGAALGAAVAAHNGILKVVCDGNRLGNDSAAAFAGALRKRGNRLASLSLARNHLVAPASRPGYSTLGDGVEQLLRALGPHEEGPASVALLELDLSGNAGIRDAGATAAAAALLEHAAEWLGVGKPRRSGLRCLNLSSCGIGAAGAAALGAALRHGGCGGPLTELALDGNPIGSGAALLLCRCLSVLPPAREAATVLSLCGCNLDTESAPLLSPLPPPPLTEEEEAQLDAEEEDEAAALAKTRLAAALAAAAGCTEAGAQAAARAAMRRPGLKAGRAGTGALDVLAWPLAGGRGDVRGAWQGGNRALRGGGACTGEYAFDCARLPHRVALAALVEAVGHAPGYAVSELALNGKKITQFERTDFALDAGASNASGSDQCPEAHRRAAARMARARGMRGEERATLAAAARGAEERATAARRAADEADGKPPWGDDPAAWPPAPALDEDEQAEKDGLAAAAAEAQRVRWGWLDELDGAAAEEEGGATAGGSLSVLAPPPELASAVGGAVSGLPEEGVFSCVVAWQPNGAHEELLRPSLVPPEGLATAAMKQGKKGTLKRLGAALGAAFPPEASLCALCVRLADRFAGSPFLLEALRGGLALTAEQDGALEKAAEERDWDAERAKEKALLKLMGDAELNEEMERREYMNRFDPETMRRKAMAPPTRALLKRHGEDFHPLNRLQEEGNPHGGGGAWYVLRPFPEVRDEEDEKTGGPKAAKKQAAAPAAAPRAWTLEKSSVWAPRPKQHQGGANPFHDFYDQPPFHNEAKGKDARDRLFRCDWRRMAKSSHAQALLASVAGADEDEVREVRDEIAAYYSTVCSAFDFYAACGNGSPFSISDNSFKDFLEDCRIPERRSKFISTELITGMFVAVNVEAKDRDHKGEDQAAEAERKLENDANDDRQLLRFEFLEILLRIAFAKFLQTGRTNDPSDAVQMLCTLNIYPNLEIPASEDRNIWRRERLYCQGLSDVLTGKLPVLKAIFAKLAQTNRMAAAEPRLTCPEWCKFCNNCGFYDEAFSKREAKLVFVRSKLRVVDEVKHKLMWQSLGFIDFLEALPRVAELKFFPDEAQLLELVASSESLCNMMRTNDEAQEDRAASPGKAARRGSQKDMLAEHEVEKETKRKKAEEEGDAAAATDAAGSGKDLDRLPTLKEWVTWGGNDDWLREELAARAARSKPGASLWRGEEEEGEEEGAGGAEAAGEWPKKVKVADGEVSVYGATRRHPLARKTRQVLDLIWLAFDADDATMGTGDVAMDKNRVCM